MERQDTHYEFLTKILLSLKDSKLRVNKYTPRALDVWVFGM